MQNHPQPLDSSGSPRPKRQHRPSRKRKEMEDEDYVEEEEEESEDSESDSGSDGYRTKPRKWQAHTVRSAAAAAAAAKKRAQNRRSPGMQSHSQSHQPTTVPFANADEEYTYHARRLQEHEKAQRSAIAAKYPYPGLERDNLLRSLQVQLERKLRDLRAWHAQKRATEDQKTRSREGLVPRLIPMHQGGMDMKEQQWAVQKQDLTQLASSFTPHQRAAFQDMSSQEKYQYLEQMRQSQDHAQRHPQVQYGDLQRAALSHLSPDHIQALRQQSPVKQQETIMKLTQHFLHNQQAMYQHRRQEHLGASSGQMEGSYADMPSQGSIQTRTGMFGPVSPPLQQASIGSGVIGAERALGERGINLPTSQHAARSPIMIPTSQDRQYSSVPFAEQSTCGQSRMLTPAKDSPGTQIMGQDSPRDHTLWPSSGPKLVLASAGVPPIVPGSRDTQATSCQGMPGLNTTLAGGAQPLGQSSHSSQEQGLSQYPTHPGKQPTPRGSMSGRQLQSGTIRVGPMTGIGEAREGPWQRRPIFFQQEHLQQEIEGEQGDTLCKPIPAWEAQKALGNLEQASGVDQRQQDCTDPSNALLEDHVFADLAASFLSPEVYGNNPTESIAYQEIIAGSQQLVHSKGAAPTHPQNIQGSLTGFGPATSAPHPATKVSGKSDDIARAPRTWSTAIVACESVGEEYSASETPAGMLQCKNV